MRAINKDSGHLVARELQVAATLWSRARGLLGRSGLRQGEGLLIAPCLGVHTFFMKFPIDLIFLDRENRVLFTVERLAPQRATGLIRGSASVLELPAGTVEGSETSTGDRIEFL